jgi:hypothetical protein
VLAFAVSLEKSPVRIEPAEAGAACLWPHRTGEGISVSLRPSLILIVYLAVVPLRRAVAVLVPLSQLFHALFSSIATLVLVSACATLLHD